jgi:hypothetical protein
MQRDEAGRSPQIPAYEFEARDRDRQHADEGEAEQERAAKGHQDQAGKADDQQRPDPDPQRFLGWNGLVVGTAGDEWHPQEILSQVHGGAADGKIIVGRGLEPAERLGRSSHHRVIAALAAGTGRQGYSQRTMDQHASPKDMRFVPTRRQDVTSVPGSDACTPLCGTPTDKRRNRRDTSNSMILVRLWI